MNAKPKASCCGFFRKLNILPFYSQYIFSLLLFVIKTMLFFTINTEIHAINTRQNINLRLPSVKLMKYEKGVYYMGTIIFNYLPRDIRELLYESKILKQLLKISFSRSHFIQSVNTSSGQQR
jgi:hypothetical protein